MDTNEIIIEQVIESSLEIVDAHRNLVYQLTGSESHFSESDLEEIIQSPQSFLFIAREVSSKKIAGTIIVTIFRIPDSKKAYFDDLIVDDHFRGRGIATLLFNKAVTVAKENNAEYIELTSNPKRAAAIHLYEKLGFTKRETNVYRLKL